MSELKPCPFCGKETAEVECDGAFWWVKCQSCGASGHVYWFILNNGNARDIVIDNWNTRPIEDALNARIAELEAEIAKLKAENAKLETERRWIPLNERQPEVGSNVVLVNANKGKEYYALQVSEWMVDELDMFHTHWMRLPEPPEVGE